MFSCSGEILEKATRVLTDEDKALLETDFVGKNGQRRKLEVRFMFKSSSLVSKNADRRSSILA